MRLYMADNYVKLIDVDTGFIIVSSNMRVEIEYGQFAISLANSSCNDMYKLFSDFITHNHYLEMAQQLQKKSILPRLIGEDVIDLIFKDLYAPTTQLLAKDDISPQQAMAISRLLLHELIYNFMNDKQIDLNHLINYIPLIFASDEVHQHIRKMLLTNTSAFTSDLQNEINQLNIPMSIMTLDDGTPVTVYEIENTLSYLVLDLQKYFLSKKRVVECHNCHKLFYPNYRKSEIYCRYEHADGSKTCNIKMQHSTDDDFAKLARRARGYQHSRCYNSSTQQKYNKTPDFLSSLYEEWSSECRQQHIYFKELDDFKGFQKWVDDTKFTANKLEELFQKYSNKK